MHNRNMKPKRKLPYRTLNERLLVDLHNSIGQALIELRYRQQGMVNHYNSIARNR